MTTPQLFAMALDRACPSGRHRCLWCGAPCGEDFPISAHLSDTFLGYGEVAFPASRFICGGCAVATDESDRSRRPRMFSYIITGAKTETLLKTDNAKIAAVCIRPPEPPFSIIISTSGQKHLLYRAPVNQSRQPITVQFETEALTFTPQRFAARFDLCRRIAAACGKPALAERPSARLSTSLANYYESFDPLLTWFDISQEPLSRLCAYLIPAMKECQHEYPATRAAADVRRQHIPPEASRADGPGLFGG